MSLETSALNPIFGAELNEGSVRMATPARPGAAPRTGETPEPFYRDLVLSMRNGVLAIQRDGSVAVINDVAYRILGLRPDPVHLGRRYTDLLGRHHEFSKVLETAFELSHLPNRAELRLAPAGKVVGYTLSRIVDEFGTVSGAVLYFKDLTRVEQLEERERLKDRLAALGEMAAAIAHEVKNPLASIQVMAGLLKRQAPKSNDDQAILNDIISEVQVANKIVVDLLEFVRPINLQIEPVSIPDLLQETVMKCDEQMIGCGVIVKRRVHDDLPNVTGDYSRLRQLFTNLLVNAFEALNGHGQVTVTATSAAPAIDHLADGSETGGWVVVDVEDDGPGIPNDVTEKIFSPFFTTKPRGSGLGLAIVRKIVDAHDGRIDVSARREGGTRFQVTLPIERAPDGAETASHLGRHSALR